MDTKDITGAAIMVGIVVVAMVVYFKVVAPQLDKS